MKSMTKNKVNKMGTVVDHQNMTVEEIQKARTNELIEASLAGQVIMAKLTSCKDSILPFVVELRNNGDKHSKNVIILRKFLNVSHLINKDIIEREIHGIREDWIRRSLLSNISDTHYENAMIVHADPTGILDKAYY